MLTLRIDLTIVSFLFMIVMFTILTILNLLVILSIVTILIIFMMTNPRRIVQRLVELALPAQLRRWLGCRLCIALGRGLHEGEIELCWVRMRASLCALPTVVGLAVLRVIGNAWPTSSRIGGIPLGCACGCAAVGHIAGPEQRLLLGQASAPGSARFVVVRPLMG